MFDNKKRRHVILKTKNHCPKLNKPKLSINSQLIFFLQNFYLTNLGDNVSSYEEKFALFIPIRIACNASEWGLFNLCQPTVASFIRHWYCSLAKGFNCQKRKGSEILTITTRSIQTL